MDNTIYNSVVERCVSDPKFRADFLKDPRLSLSKYFGFSAPEDLTISVIEKKSWDSIEFIIPPATISPCDDDLAQLRDEVGPLASCLTSVQGATCWVLTKNAPTCDICD